MKAILLSFALWLTFNPSHSWAEQYLAVYVEYGGKVIELHTSLISPLYDGLGEVIYSALEADELATPESAKRIGSNLSLIGWRREGDKVVIYFGGKNTVSLPESAMRYKVIEVLPTSDKPNRTKHRQPT